jgi:hypothetical protein
LPGVSFEQISRADLRRLARIADEEREDLFARRPDWRLLYGRRLLCAALTGRSATHCCNGSVGVVQFDVCLFFAAHAEAAFPHRWTSLRDFGSPKFGRAGAEVAYTGRRVRLTGRSIDCRPGDNPVAALQAYLRRGRTPIARQLRKDAVVLIGPKHYLGYVAWPTLVP